MTDFRNGRIFEVRVQFPGMKKEVVMSQYRDAGTACWDKHHLQKSGEAIYGIDGGYKSYVNYPLVTT